ncbi:hypothetical protein C3747_277g32 [Trypanosoma cruzi]|uniref:Uncharacterized protein n=1 Tax=Trypanosoma cruzi TaxID=5693 RepID=A0A2V2VE80_TRYCR|nr:hypothetical protein C3747_277g32 [Trypanosoma cruzi]
MHSSPPSPIPFSLMEDKNESLSFLPNVRRSGMWELITEETMGRTNTRVEQFCFFTVTRREVLVKKTAKGSPAQTTLAMEETARWIVPPKSSVEVTVVFCSDGLDKLTFPSRLELQVQLKKSPCLFLRAPHTQRFAEIIKKYFPSRSHVPSLENGQFVFL